MIGDIPSGKTMMLINSKKKKKRGGSENLSQYPI